MASVVMERVFARGQVVAERSSSVEVRPMDSSGARRCRMDQSGGCDTFTVRRIFAVGAVCLIIAGCDSSDSAESRSEQSPSTESVPPVEPAGSETMASTPAITPVDEADWNQLEDELVEMARIDQEERADFGDPDLEEFNDEPRTARLIEIVDRYGWPTPELAGEEANRAAFLLTQHSDSDPAFQERVLSLIKASGDYPGQGEQQALLTDRVAVNSDEPQVFGTQVNCNDGQPIVSPALARPDSVDSLRDDAGLEPLDIYLARFNQHCADVALIPQNAGCGPIGGFNQSIEPNAVLLVGELHGTDQSPGFVGEFVCTALSYGYEVTLGLEIPDAESAAVETFLRSDGSDTARDALLAGPFWTAEFKDGRQSTAMLKLLEDLRQHTTMGETLEVVLLDAYDVDDRDAAMAERLLESINEDTYAIAIALTGNLHNRTVRGIDFDPDYEPMGYLVKQELGPRRVRSLDVRYSGGQAWGCESATDCGARTWGATPNSETPTNRVLPTIEIESETTGSAYDGYYLVGELTPSAPAIGT